MLHVITGLGTGGAEMMLFKLLQATQGAIESRVVALMERGPLADRIEALGVPVHCLGLTQGALPGPGTVAKFLRLARSFKPSIVQGWMYHGNLAALLVSYTRPLLYWNIRQTLYGLRLEGRMTRWIIRLGAWLSRRPQKIIYNSRVSAQQHEAAGFTSANRVVIPNGFDLEAFRPNPDDRASVRAEFALPDSALLVGHVARFHPMKGHAELLKAAEIVAARNPNAYFLLVGRHVNAANNQLTGTLDALGLNGRVLLAGERHDVPRIAAALDVAVSASTWGEGFPNAVGEAMAAGVPCVVTDIGDSAWVVGDCGRVVPPGDAERLAAAIVELLALDADSLRHLGIAARDRVARMFSLEQVGRMYLDLYRAAGAT